MNADHYQKRLAEKDAEIERALDRIRLLKEQRAELDRLLDERTLERRGICPRCRYQLTPDREPGALERERRITWLEEQRDALIEEQVAPNQQAEINRLRKQLAATRGRISDLGRQNSELRDQIEILNQKLDAAQKHARKQQSRADKAEADARRLREQIGHGAPPPEVVEALHNISEGLDQLYMRQVGAPDVQRHATRITRRLEVVRQWLGVA